MKKRKLEKSNNKPIELEAIDQQIMELKKLQNRIDRRDQKEKEAVELMEKGQFQEALKVLKNI